MDYQYIQNQIDRYNNAQTQGQRDDCLYRIGTHANILELDEQSEIDAAGGVMPAKYRLKILQALYCDLEQEVDESDNLLLHIFGRDQLQQWYEDSKQRYPHFELCFGLRPSEDCTCFEMTCYFQPLQGAPATDPGCDFPWQPFWDCAEMFWFTTDVSEDGIGLCFACYPDEASFRLPGQRMQDWQLEVPDDDDLTAVSDLLEVDEATVSGNLHQPIQTPAVSGNLIDDPRLWSILQPPA